MGIDANGIVQVSASDKGTGKSEQIQITADKGRLSQEEIERMVREAEEFAEEDKIMKETIDARNNLEGYAYSMKNTVNDDDKLGSKIDAKDKETIEEAVTEVIDWLEKHKEIEGICNPIVQKLYKEHGAPNQGGAGGPGGAGGKPADGKKAGLDDDDYDIPDDHDEL